MNVGAVVFAKNVNVLSEFYEKLLGLSVVLKESDKCVLESNSLTLTVHGIPLHIAENIEISVPPEIRENTAVKMCFPVVSIIEARTLASSKGGCVYTKANEWENNKFIACDGYDPEGNVFQVCENKQA